MSQNDELVDLLTRWFEQADEAACAQATQLLAAQMWPTSETLRALGRGVLDEIRQDVLADLLDRSHHRLQGAHTPIAYAKRAWRNAQVSVLRTLNRREKHQAQIRQHMTGLVERDGHTTVERRLDAHRAIEIAAALPGRDRLAVLLTTRPDYLSDEDWQKIAAALPPPPPPRPSAPLDREEASRLLYPPQTHESDAQRRQRLNSFDKLFQRTAVKIREALQEVP